jgi:hypothetical protein
MSLVPVGLTWCHSQVVPVSQPPSPLGLGVRTLRPGTSDHRPLPTQRNAERPPHMNRRQRRRDKTRDPGRGVQISPSDRPDEATGWVHFSPTKIRVSHVREKIGLRKTLGLLEVPHGGL